MPIPSLEDLVKKYERKVDVLKPLLVEIKEIRDRIKSDEENTDDADNQYYSILAGLEFALLKKGIKMRIVEVERELQQCYKQIGRYTLQLRKENPVSGDGILSDEILNRSGR